MQAGNRDLGAHCPKPKSFLRKYTIVKHASLCTALLCERNVSLTRKAPFFASNDPRKVISQGKKLYKKTEWIFNADR